MKALKIAEIMMAGVLAATAAGCSINTGDDPSETASEAGGTYGASYYDEDLSYLTLANYIGVEIEEDLSVSEFEIIDEYYDDLLEISDLNTTDDDGLTVEHDLYKEYKSMLNYDRAIVSGDIVNIDFTGYMDGEEFSGGSSTDYDLIIGSETFITGFEDALIGHKPGETIDIDLNFPDPYYNNTDYSGKAVTFTTTINYILPEISDESCSLLANVYIASSSSETAPYTDAETYKAYVTADLKEAKEDDFEEYLSSNLVYKIYTESVFDPFPEDKLEEVKETYENYASNYSLDAATYLYYMYGISSDEELESFYKFQVGADCVIAAIIQKEKFTITEDEWNEAIEYYVSYYGFDDAEAFLEQVGQADFANMLLSDKALQFIEDNAVITKIE